MAEKDAAGIFAFTRRHQTSFVADETSEARQGAFSVARIRYLSGILRLDRHLTQQLSDRSGDLLRDLFALAPSRIMADVHWLQGSRGKT